jgi:hypothetical protein
MSGVVPRRWAVRSSRQTRAAVCGGARERLFRTTTRESHDCGRLGPVEKKDVSENDKKKRSFDVFTVVLFLARATRRIPL